MRRDSTAGRKPAPTGSRLHVLQVNLGSVRNKLDLLRSRVYEERPDVVVVQEDWIEEAVVPYKVDGYVWLHFARTQPRSSAGNIRGGGVSILVNIKNPCLHFQQLPAFDLGSDMTTEMIRV